MERDMKIENAFNKVNFGDLNAQFIDNLIVALSDLHSAGSDQNFESLKLLFLKSLQDP